MAAVRRGSRDSSIISRQRHDNENLWLALKAGTDVAGPYHSSSSSKSCSNMDMSCGSHWQEKDLCRRNACRCSKEVATQRRKGGGTIARWSGKLDDCGGGRVYQHKEG